TKSVSPRVTPRAARSPASDSAVAGPSACVATDEGEEGCDMRSVPAWAGDDALGANAAPRGIVASTALGSTSGVWQFCRVTRRHRRAQTHFATGLRALTQAAPPPIIFYVSMRGRRRGACALKLE